MCKFCTTEDITASVFLKDGVLVHERDEAIPHLCFFSRAFGDKAALVKINNCPWCGRELGQ